MVLDRDHEVQIKGLPIERNIFCVKKTDRVRKTRLRSITLAANVGKANARLKWNWSLSSATQIATVVKIRGSGHCLAVDTILG